MHHNKATPGIDSALETEVTPLPLPNGVVDEQTFRLDRRGFLRIGLASFLAFLLEHLQIHKAYSQTASRLRPMVQLTAIDAAAFTARMLERSKPFRLLRDKFAADGFQFIPERSKAFQYTTPTKSGSSSNVLGVLPSFVRTKSTDPFHRAVGIVVHHKGLAIASSVRVDHRPFQISEFAVHEVTSRGEIVSRSIDAKVVASASTEAIADLLGRPELPSLRPDAASAPPSLAEQSRIVAATFEQLIQDRFARPLYPPEGLRALLAQTDIITKFAVANSVRYRKRLEQEKGFGELGISLCCSSSSSTNACTSTSTSTIEI